MRALRHDEARRTLLPDLPVGQEKALLHLLTCPACHEQIVTRLQDSLDDNGDENPPLRKALQDGGGHHIQAALRKAHEALRDDLLAAPGGVAGKRSLEAACTRCSGRS